MRLLSKNKITSRFWFLFGIFAVTLLLGALSIRPFSSLYLPLLKYDQWRRAHREFALRDDCLNRIKARGYEFIQGDVPVSQRQVGCNIDSGLIITSGPIPFENIALTPREAKVTLSCSFAESLFDFVEKDLSPLSLNMFGTKPKKILHMGGYACREQPSFFHLLSSHAFAEAFDFAGVELEDGRVVLVEQDFQQGDEKARFLNELARRACQHFGTVLGPAYDAAHKNHLHFSQSFPNVCQF